MEPISRLMGYFQRVRWWKGNPLVGERGIHGCVGVGIHLMCLIWRRQRIFNGNTQHASKPWKNSALTCKEMFHWIQPIIGALNRNKLSPRSSNYWWKKGALTLRQTNKFHNLTSLHGFSLKIIFNLELWK